MKVNEIKDILGARIIAGAGITDIEVEYGYGCDLMSDVLAYVQNNVVLLTGLVHPQVIRTAEMLDIRVIVVVRGKEPSQELVSMAENSDIVIMTTGHSLFTASGLLFAGGLKGEEIAHNEFAI